MSDSLGGGVHAVSGRGSDRAGHGRQRLSMDPEWRFALGDPAGAERPAFDDHAWRRLDLPHDWSIEGTMRQDAPGGGQFAFLPGGIGWYRKAFRMPASARGLEARLEFDGVYMNSDVWINGVHLGKRPYGYISFAYDITQHLVPGVNVVAVRVDNSAQPNSRWYTGSGIYRHVWLTLSDSLHVAHWGTYVTTPRADSTRADVVVRTQVENDRTTARRGTLRSIVLDDAGREVARVDTAFSLAAGQRLELEQQLHVATPRLWSVEQPYLYALRTEVLDGAKPVDVVTTSFGIRTIAFDKDRGFLLNGRRVKMNGVNLHHDAGGLGAAVPEGVWERRLALLRSMGVNAIRTSHNPPAPEFLDLCDRMGFLVMAEAFDEWTVGKVPGGYHKYFAEWSERDVTDFVHRDRNHPSIVLWSAGNEIGEQSAPNGAQVLRRLVDIFHREDPTRPVTTGNDHIVADGHPATLAFLNAEDIVGYNYVDRWHERRELFAEEDRHDHPDWQMIGTESGSIFQSFDERYSLGTDPAVVRPNYTTGMLQAERLWKWVAMHDYFAGDFMWTGVDYLGEAVWPFQGFPPASSTSPASPRTPTTCTRASGRPTSAPPLPALELARARWPGHSGAGVHQLQQRRAVPERPLAGREAHGVSRAGHLGRLEQLRAAGRQPDDERPASQLGRAVRAGRAAGGRQAARRGRVPNDEVRTAGAAAAIRLVADRDTVADGRGDVAHVTFEIVDSAGTVVPTADDLVRVTVTGGDLLALDNADLQDQSRYRTGQRRAFNGRGLAIVRATKPGLCAWT